MKTVNSWQRGPCQIEVVLLFTKTEVLIGKVGGLAWKFLIDQEQSHQGNAS